MKFQIKEAEFKYLGGVGESTIKRFVSPSHLLAVTLVRVDGEMVSGHPDMLCLHFSSNNSQFAIICENVRRALNSGKILEFPDLDFLTPIKPSNVKPKTISSKT